MQAARRAPCAGTVSATSHPQAARAPRLRLRLAHLQHGVLVTSLDRCHALCIQIQRPSYSASVMEHSTEASGCHLLEVGASLRHGRLRWHLSTHLMLGELLGVEQVRPDARAECRPTGKRGHHTVASSDNVIMLLHGHYVRAESVERVSPMQLRTVGPPIYGHAFDAGHLTYKTKSGKVIMIRSSLYAFGDFVDWGDPLPGNNRPEAGDGADGGRCCGVLGS
eukprot:270277-Amphidinium_carterae.2